MRIKKIGASETVISFQNGLEVFVSYETPVAAFIPDEGYVRTDKSWSRTTTKHINKWVDGIAATKPQTFFDNLLNGASENV